MTSQTSIVAFFDSSIALITPGAPGFLSFVNDQLSPSVSEEMRPLFPYSVVMFDDGTTAGRASGVSIDQIKASYQSVYDLLSSVFTYDMESVIRRLQALRDAVPPGSRPDFSKDRYGEWYRYYESRLASRLMDIAKRDGVQGVLEAARPNLTVAIILELISERE
jgi:hypothetical protein